MMMVKSRGVVKKSSAVKQPLITVQAPVSATLQVDTAPIAKELAEQQRVFAAFFRDLSAYQAQQLEFIQHLHAQLHELIGFLQKNMPIKPVIVENKIENKQEKAIVTKPNTFYVEFDKEDGETVGMKITPERPN
jgi:hypothetical protein